MPEHTIGTREEWQAARDELATLEAEHAALTQKVTEQRRQLPWVPVEKEYEFDTQEWSKQVGAKLEDGLREAPSYIAFARDDDGRVYHTYTVTAPDPFVSPFHSFLLRRTPRQPADETWVYRKDEYPN